LWDHADDDSSYNEYGIVKNSYIELYTTDQPMRLGVYNAENTDADTQNFSFTIESDATKAYFYPGVSINTKHLEVKFSNDTVQWTPYDDDPVPEYVDLSPYINTSGTYLRPDTYDVTVNLRLPKFTRGTVEYNAIFTGSRVLVTYAQIFGQEWTESYTGDQTSANEEARKGLADALASVGETIEWNSSEIQASSAYASAYPVTSYFILKIWEED